MLELRLQAVGESGESRRVVIHHDESSIRIALEGCGMMEMESGFEEVVLLELQPHGFRLYVWNDINDANPRVIEMAKAAEGLRKDPGGS